MGLRLDINSVAPATNSATCQHVYRTNYGRFGRDRTDDLEIKNLLLSQLSYEPKSLAWAKGLEPSLTERKSAVLAAALRPQKLNQAFSTLGPYSNSGHCSFDSKLGSELPSLVVLLTT